MHEVLVNCLLKACPGKSMVRGTNHPALDIGVHLGRKATTKTKIKDVCIDEYLVMAAQELGTHLRLCDVTQHLLNMHKTDNLASCTFALLLIFHLKVDFMRKICTVYDNNGDFNDI